MQCTEAQERLMAYVLGEVAPDEAARIGGHLEACYFCSEAHERWRHAVDTMRCALQHPRPVNEFDALMFRIRREERRAGRAEIRPRSWRGLRRVAGLTLAAAAAVLLVVIALPWDTASHVGATLWASSEGLESEQVLDVLRTVVALRPVVDWRLEIDDNMADLGAGLVSRPLKPSVAPAPDGRTPDREDSACLSTGIVRSA